MEDSFVIQPTILPSRKTNIFPTTVDFNIIWRMNIILDLQAPLAESFPQQRYTCIRCKMMLVSSIYVQASQPISFIE